MKKLWILSIILTMALAFYSCSSIENPVVPEDTPETPDTPKPADARNISEKSDFESYFDMSTYAGDDFYQYAVGKWLQNNPLKEMQMSLLCRRVNLLTLLTC